MYKIKKAIVRTSLLALGTAFEIVSKRDRDLRAEIGEWEEGRVFSLAVLPDGPAIVLKNESGRIRCLGSRPHDSQPRILFKNMDCAFMPLTGLMSADMAFVQHRAILEGNVGAGMEVARAIAIVQNYLLPGFMLKRVCKRVPRFTPGQMLLKIWVLAALLPRMAANLGK